MTRSQVSGAMKCRERFLEVMRLGQPDRVPYFEEGIRDEVIHVWQEQGLSGRHELAKTFPSDERERMVLDLELHPELKKWPTTENDLDLFRQHLNPDDAKRFPEQWKKHVRRWQHREHVLMLYVHEGFFLSMGVGNWQRFYEVMVQVLDNPGLVRKMMLAKGQLAAALTEKVLKKVKVDAVVFSEPIGGIDLDALRGSKADIKQEIQTKVPPLIDQGGYIPLADGRVREDVSYENYCYYRELLRRIIEKA